MLLRFKPATKDPSDILDTAYVRSLWQRSGSSYSAAAQKVTGLTFINQGLTVSCGQYKLNTSGIAYREAVKITTHRFVAGSGFKHARKEDNELLAVLTHELGHRLLAEHRIVPPYPYPRRDYEMHRMLFVFLYDTWVTAFGEAKAKEFTVYHDYPNEPEYREHYDSWNWARHLPPNKRKRLTAYLVKHKRLPAGPVSSSVPAPSFTPQKDDSFLDAWRVKRTSTKASVQHGPWAKRYF